MSKYNKLLGQILRGVSDANINFEKLRELLVHIGFTERIKSSHHIYLKEGIEEIINIQSKNGKGKPYQIKQIRNIIVKYKLGVKEDE
ncbi:type II toxin-antitoxin system HicA family toxin [Candidatus Magnetomonas plexicatena]|uniref:type II toxin-antitoxin system HicA family toxin n=1 Tax=Candidatus Magnetomonas plexicatena TaxID=2552947 RepID=UPI0011055CC1|nr:type II toxin-antitoxin system HicA family toxin [Nitrospirales bacterium LBB_01]